MNSNDVSFFRLIYILKRLTDEWADKRLKTINSGFKMSYAPVFMSIPPAGTSNGVIAKELHITKMAASKTIKELTKHGLVKTLKDEKDHRFEIILLTKKGEDLVRQIKEMALELTSDYEKLLNKKAYKQMIDLMVLINNYHER